MEKYKELLQREITREQFIRYVGVASVGLLGFGNVIALLKKPEHGLPPAPAKGTAGFGSRKFGA
jgi:hypothetical protein